MEFQLKCINSDAAAKLFSLLPRRVAFDLSLICTSGRSTTVILYPSPLLLLLWLSLQDVWHDSSE